ncbi:phage tail protein [Labrenzia sp. R4_2]|uniref:phage tail-collar fiber domain-containing protein n=1 Tax=Labrenzia sp. R4_2 TaxID=2821107 RepID=UPI001ADC8EE1|nr:phage tail protein [Labrenzia sp. R4_2]MBO9421694.1 phage tail protein [Labrenzia sp. R4_2]
MPTYSILTTTGKNKEAAALANGTPLRITHLAFGDGDYAPTGGETSLQNEIVRKPVQGSGTVPGAPNTALFDCLLEAEDGPYTIREGAVIDDDGDMVAIIKYDPPVNKPVPSSGQTVEALMRAHVVFSDLENLVIQIQAINAFVSAERRIDTEDGVDGGGDLSQDRTFKLAVQNLDEITGDQVSEAEGNIDWILLRDSSAGNHKKLRPSEFALALGVQDKINTSLAEHLADIPETKAGDIDDKAVHPEGLHAALAEKLGGGFNVRSFEHANDSNAPTALEWVNPVNGDKGLVSNADQDSLEIWQRRLNQWVSLGSIGGSGGLLGGQILGIWSGVPNTGSQSAASGLTWQSNSPLTFNFAAPGTHAMLIGLMPTSVYVTHVYPSWTSATLTYASSYEACVLLIGIGA